MADRVARAVVDVGAGAEAVGYVLRAYEAAMRPREDSGLSEDAADFLRPGRTVLILTDDVGEADPRVLAVGALAESRLSEFRVDTEVTERILASDGVGDDGIEWWRALPSLRWESVPTEGQADAQARSDERAVQEVRAQDERVRDERLLEDLVIATLPVQRVALSEALDQIRHAHLWKVLSQRRRAAAIARRVLHPLATRVDPTLARRYGWWLRRVGPALERPTTGAAKDRAPSGA
jgi:hypothetical protein